MARKINYYSRNFADVREELINFVKQYYPDIFNDFNDASVGMMMLELNAAVSDMLSFHTDRMFQETQLDYAQERKSVLSMARTFGLKIPGKRSSISLVDFQVTVPVNSSGDGPDLNYAPIVKRGSQVNGGGQTFETVDDIDFSSPFNISGIPNWLIIPQYNTNNNITSYIIVKKELVVNGKSKVFKVIIRPENIKPFFEVILPDNNVLSVESIITLEGTDYSEEPTIDQFYSFDNRWFEVAALAEDKVFIEDGSRTSSDASIKPGHFVKTNRRFITEYTDNNFFKIMFGSGSQDVDSLTNFNISSSFASRIGDIINNLSLGQTPNVNNTMYISYRVGGGANTNLGPNTITSLGIVDVRVNGSNAQTNFGVERSFKVRASTLALGGRDEPSVDEIKNLIRYNFSAQNRAVTIKDYLTIIKTMPSEYGVPFRLGVFEEQNKVKVSILTLNSEGKLSNSSNEVLRGNLANYLSDYRMINDYVEIGNGKIFNLGFEVDLFVDKNNSQAEISNNVINTINDYMNINNHEMGEDLFIGRLLEDISNVTGVINVIDIRVYNKVGIEYSFNEVSQPYINNETRQIDLSDTYTVFGEPNAMFEVKLGNRDVKIRIKTRA